MVCYFYSILSEDETIESRVHWSAHSTHDTINWDEEHLVDDPNEQLARLVVSLGE